MNLDNYDDVFESLEDMVLLIKDIIDDDVVHFSNDSKDKIERAKELLSKAGR